MSQWLLPHLKSHQSAMLEGIGAQSCLTWGTHVPHSGATSLCHARRHLEMLESKKRPMSERWQDLMGASSEQDVESSDHPLDTNANGRSMQPGKPAVAVITASGEMFGGKLHGTMYVNDVGWPHAGSLLASGLYAEPYKCSRLLPPFVSRVQLSHICLARCLCPRTCIAFMLTFTLCPLTAGSVPPSTHSPRSDAILSMPLCKLLREAGADRRVCAVVLRVDSPGAHQVHPAWRPMSCALHC